MISNEHIQNVCQPGTPEACAYLVCGAEGFECGRLSAIRFHIDLRLANGDMNAVLINCNGVSDTGNISLVGDLP